MRNCSKRSTRYPARLTPSIEGAGRHDRRVFLSMAMVELARIPAKEGFSGAIEVRRSCGGERSDAGALSEKNRRSLSGLS
jgi:hypothetical protein